MANTVTSTRVMKSDVVNDVIVYNYDADEYAEYVLSVERYKQELEEYQQRMIDIFANSTPDGSNSQEPPEPPEQPEVENALDGLEILDVHVTESSKMTSSPVESGIEVCDFKVRMPRTITIKGICNNRRGKSTTTKDTRYGAAGTDSAGFAAGVDRVPLVGGAINSVIGGVVNEVMGYEYEQSEDILTVARRVYASIQYMLRDENRLKYKDGVYVSKTYTIGTKGAVYSNMVLADVDQLNDAEHLMVIPVTLHFKELIVAGSTDDYQPVLDEQNSNLKMSGYLKKNSWMENISEFGASVSSKLSF